MKMGTIASPWRHDAFAGRESEPPVLRHLALLRSVLVDLPASPSRRFAFGSRSAGS